jgi:hypothetical protein
VQQIAATAGSGILLANGLHRGRCAGFWLVALRLFFDGEVLGHQAPRARQGPQNRKDVAQRGRTSPSRTRGLYFRHYWHTPATQTPLVHGTPAPPSTASEQGTQAPSTQTPEQLLVEQGSQAPVSRLQMSAPHSPVWQARQSPPAQIGAVPEQSLALAQVLQRPSGWQPIGHSRSASQPRHVPSSQIGVCTSQC